MGPLELRSTIYRHIVETGTAPGRVALAEVVGDLGSTDELLRPLHDRHMIVLDDRPHRLGEIRMALPFSSEPTDFVVTARGGTWWANCAWDSLAILAALDTDGTITSTWSDTGEPAHLAVVDGEVVAEDGVVHFAVPARHWWDDIVFT